MAMVRAASAHSGAIADRIRQDWTAPSSPMRRETLTRCPVHPVAVVGVTGVPISWG